MTAPAATTRLRSAAPARAEQAELIAHGVPAAFLRHALDPAEQPRVQHDPSGATLIVFRVPDGGSATGKTLSLAMVLAPELVAIIASGPTTLVDAARTSTTDPVADLAHAIAAAFVVRVDEIDRTVERLEDRLRTSQRNEEVLGLLECQKALVHLERALAADALLLERLRDDDVHGSDPATRRRLEEALVEMRQALQMTTISAEILASMMDAFASIISNNLNHAMKLMAALMIMLAIPTMIAGLWGMNVPLPGGHAGWAFGVLVSATIACSLAVGFWFRRKRWL